MRAIYLTLLWSLFVSITAMSDRAAAGEPLTVPMIATANEVPLLSGCGCFDDYCRKSWQPRCEIQTSFYRCVSAGECGCHSNVRRQTWSWWFVPQPTAIIEAIRFNR